MRVKIYTDGACKGNPGPGGWGVLMVYGDHEKTFSGGTANTTNNRMELQAAIEGLNALNRPCVVDLYTDSSYVQKGITQWLESWKNKGWKNSQKKPVKNIDLWQALDAATQRHQVSWHWVKGHAGHLENERADALANEGVEKIMQGQ